MATRAVPPKASALIASLRGVGYSLETAIADLIDNSVAANANVVEIKCEWHEGNPIVSLLDDGDGMSEARLVEAMRFGGVGPDTVRNGSDLGRFGLGLKTASLSQCRKLTVLSKDKSSSSAFTWDIDKLAETNTGWDLIEGDDNLSSEYFHSLQANKTGTAVVWRKVDFGRREDMPDQKGFFRDLEHLERHLGMVFHRYLDGDGRKLVLLLNGEIVRAWDPFLELNNDTIRTPIQHIDGPGGRVWFRGFVLPHRDRFKNQGDLDLAGGPEGWIAQQGFYIYRQKRLLSAGGWLGLGGSKAWTRDESSRLARLRVDIPNSADQDWRIDIRKSIARPPDAIKRRLQQLATDVRRTAREIFVHRGQYGARHPATEISRVWTVNPVGAPRRYTIGRDHPAVSLVKTRLPSDARGLFDALFDLIERTVPVDRVWLDVSEHGVPPSMTVANEQETLNAALEMATVMEKAGMNFSEALVAVQCMDPFDKIENFLEKAKQNLKRVRI